VSADDFAFLHQATLRGVGIALMPQFIVAQSLERGELTRVLPDYVGLRGLWHLVYPSSRYLPRRAAAFRDLVLSELGTPTSG
jgi:DNA-binding transcriptional LysR family regulator